MTRILTPGRLRVAAVGVTALIPASLVYALAHADTTARARTSVSVRLEGGRLSGTVRSPRQACEAGRTVLLMERGRVVATALTDEVGGVGRWSTGSADLDGTYYAMLPRTDRCRAAVSAPVDVQR